jgi:two-component system OmpR family sensor kinase
MSATDRGWRGRLQPAVELLRSWQRAVRRVTGRIPLRVRLVAALVVLSTLALATVGVAATTMLERSLVSRVDGQTRGFADRVAGDLAHGEDPFAPRLGGGPGPQLPGAFVVVYASPQGLGKLWIPEGQTVPAPAVGDLIGRAQAEAPRPFTVSVHGHRWRVEPAGLPGGATVVVAVSLDEVDRTVGQLVLIEVGVGVAVLLLLGAGGYLVVRSSLRPLVEVEHTAAAIAAGDLTLRVPERDPRTEVGRLGRALNGMLGQIETAFRAREASETNARASEDRMRRFVADASHELRTPLSSIRGFAELYRQGAVPDRSDVDRVMRRIEDEAVRMGVLVEDLLLLARVDQQRPLDHAPVDLLAVATDAVHDARAVAPDRKIDLDLLDSDVPPVVLGDDARLRQVVTNLVGNALTHTPVTAAIRVRVGVRGDEAVLEVADDGPGLAAEDAARVFERFYRADPSRTRSSGGTGLGLSIVAALVAAHGGTVEVDTAPGAGAVFRVRLPAPVTVGDAVPVD